MDALMAAIVLGALCQAGDRTPWLAAILADRFRQRWHVIAAAALALALNYVVGTLVGLLLRPLLTPNAQLFLLGIAVAYAGAGTPWRSRSPDRLEGWRLGAWGTSLAGLAIIAFFDRMQLVVAALAIRSPLPWLAAVGATIGALAVVVPAALVGEAAWLRLPHRAIRLASALILIGVGLWLGSQASYLL